MYACPSALKSEEECIASLQHFVSSTDKVGNFYSDNAKELKSAAKKLGWRHELSKAHIHESNAVAERAVRATTEGTRPNLLQAGLSHVYWPHALEHACTAFNISHPNGIEYSPNAEPGIFLAYNFQPGMKWRKEVLVLPIKDVVRNDYHEYITPARAYNFTAPEGDFVFPMKDRGGKVALGQATDALERPNVESLTNQDAEPAVDAPSEIPQAEAERRVEVIDPKTGKLVPIPGGGRYYDAGGTLGRRYGGQRGSTEPDGIPSTLWPTMSKQQKAKAREEAAREQARALANFQEGGSSSSSAPPAAVARDDKDNWEIAGNKLIRYHYLPRRECFRPTLRTAQFLYRASPTKGSPRSFPLAGLTSSMMRTVGATCGGEIRNSVSDGSVRLSSSFFLFPLLTEMLLSWLTFRLCPFV